MGKHKILIVEDDSDCRELLRFFLRQSGYETVEAATGFEAVSLARVTRPDLIIMDLGMPAMTGDQATARLKADPSTRDIPVIVTTAFSYGPLIDRAISAGADANNAQASRIEIASSRSAATSITGLPTGRHLQWPLLVPGW